MIKSIVVSVFMANMAMTLGFVPSNQVAVPKLRTGHPFLAAAAAPLQMTEVNGSFDNIKDEGDVVAADEAVVFDIASTSSDKTAEEKIDKLLNKALTDSVQSVHEQLPPELRDESPMSILDDPTFKEEVEKIFDKASDDLKVALADIRKEQDEFAQQSAEKSAAKTKAATAQDQARLEQAQLSMVTMIKRVNKETEQVQKAVDDLKRAQDSMSADPLMKLASGGLVKQCALAGTILFTIRSGVDTVAMVGGDSSHAIPALAQGALALGCAGYFFFSS